MKHILVTLSVPDDSVDNEKYLPYYLGQIEQMLGFKVESAYEIRTVSD